MKFHYEIDDLMTVEANSQEDANREFGLYLRRIGGYITKGEFPIGFYKRTPEEYEFKMSVRRVSGIIYQRKKKKKKEIIYGTKNKSSMV